MKYQIADLMVEYNPKYDMLKTRSEKYKMETNQESDFQMTITEQEIQEALKNYQEGTEKSVVEYVQMSSKFYYSLLKYHGCLLHASCVVVDDEAYLFSADSGTGKSTHTGLWLRYLADKSPYILNDDKPALRVFDDGVYAYGTPFSGKYDISENRKVKVKGICFLEQSDTNTIWKLESSKAIQLFLEQTTYHLSQENMGKLLDVLEVIMENVPIYKMQCNISQEAVKMSYEMMSGEKMKK